MSRLGIGIGIGVCALLVLGAGHAGAHQQDTSYLKLRIGPSALDCWYIGDVLTLQRIVPGLDANGDGVVNRDEVESARPVIQEYLQGHVFVDLDNLEADWGDPRPVAWPNDDRSPIPRADWHQLLIQFPFHRVLDRLPREVLVTCDVFIELGTNHKIVADFLVGETIRHPVVFTLEEPDYLFNVDHALVAAPDGHGVEAAKPPPGNPAGRCFQLGLAQVSPDDERILFLLVLIVASRLRQIPGVVAAFLGGQVIALISGPPGLPARWIGSAIALSIVYVAAENLWRHRAGPNRWVLGGVFGLIHGLGIAGTVRDLDVPQPGAGGCLFAFGAGIEIGQIAVVTALVPVLWWLGNWKESSAVPGAISAVTLLCGTGWLMDRFLGLGWMPF